jgi:hypothetical protein
MRHAHRSVEGQHLVDVDLLMKVAIIDGKATFYPPASFEEPEQVVCTLGDSEVTVRQSTDGTCLVVAIKGKVTMEPRSAAIWLVVK